MNVHAYISQAIYLLQNASSGLALVFVFEQNGCRIGSIPVPAVACFLRDKEPLYIPKAGRTGCKANLSVKRSSLNVMSDSGRVMQRLTDKMEKGF